MPEQASVSMCSCWLDEDQLSCPMCNPVVLVASNDQAEVSMEVEEDVAA